MTSRQKGRALLFLGVLVFGVGFMMRLVAQEPEAVRWESLAVRVLGIGLGVYGYQLMRREQL